MLSGGGAERRHWQSVYTQPARVQCRSVGLGSTLVVVDVGSISADDVQRVDDDDGQSLAVDVAS